MEQQPGQSSATTDSPAVMEAHLQDLYNSVVSGTALVIDLRSSHDFLASRLLSAVNVDGERAYEDLMKLVEPFPQIFLLENGSPGPACSNLARRVAGSITNSRVFVVIEGFETFRERYPFLCSHVPKIFRMFLTCISPTSQWSLASVNTRARMVRRRAYPSEIIEGALYLGSMGARSYVKKLGITHVVNMCGESGESIPVPGCTELKCEAFDYGNYNISKHFEETFDFIDVWRREPGTKVLVHCAMGMSRSATIVVAYLMKIKCCTLQDALTYARECRPLVSPNRGFLGALGTYEKAVMSTPSSRNVSPPPPIA